MNSLKKVELAFAILLIIVAAYFVVATYVDWHDFGFVIGSYRFNHWLVFIGSLYIAFAVPVYAILKRRYPFRTKQLLGVHVFGNLLAFVLVSIHFASQISRPAAFYPDLGTGLALYFSMLLLTATGFSHRFGIIKKANPQSQRFLHVSSAMSLYIIIGIHILQGLGLL